VRVLEYRLIEKSKTPISNHTGLVSMMKVRDKNSEYNIRQMFKHDSDVFASSFKSIH
jgi:hypothetical protein